MNQADCPPFKITIPGSPAGTANVTCEDQDTWSHLTEIPGLGVPTATAVLAALWPDKHMIIDLRDTRRRSGSEQAPSGTLTASKTPNSPTVERAPYWDLYGNWLRPKVLATATAISGRPRDVEKALYQLDRHVRSRLPKHGWTWSDYRNEAQTQLSRLT